MDLITEIKTHVKIEDLVAKLLIERGGQTSKGFFVKSIYKEEKTPSMGIDVINNTFHCFATGKGGDVIQLYQDFYNTDTSTAVKELASLFGITAANYTQRQTVKKTFQETYAETKKKFKIDELPDDEQETFYKHYEETSKDFTDLVAFERALNPVKLQRLERNTEIFEEMYRYCKTNSSKGIYESYLIEKRKLHASKLEAFKLFHISDYYKVNNHLKKNFPLEDLQRSGLFSNKKEDGTGGNLIFFNHRLIIPYLHNGRIAYLRGRYADKDNNINPIDGQPKYKGLYNDALNVNSPKRFYNIDVIKTMLDSERLYIVEGELDAIAGECLGLNTIAIPGAGNTPVESKFKKLLKYDIYLVGDNDEAGKGMIDKLIKIFFGFNKAVTLKTIPNNSKDINEFIAA